MRYGPLLCGDPRLDAIARRAYWAAVMMIEAERARRFCRTGKVVWPRPLLLEDYSRERAA